MSVFEPQPLFSNTTPSQSPDWGDESGDCLPLHMAIPDLDERAQGVEEALSPEQALVQTQKVLRQKAATAERALESERARYMKAAQELAEAQARFLRDAESETVQLALHIAKQVIANDLSLRVDFAKAMAHEALEVMRGAQDITLRVAPSDADRLQTALAESVSGDMDAVRIVKDPTLEDGGLVATCSGARFDADVKSRLKTIEQQLLAETKQVNRV